MHEKPHWLAVHLPTPLVHLARGMRIGIVRESMLKFPGVMADEPIVDAASKEIKTVLGDYLGATLVESVDPLSPDDPAIENMKPSYP